MMSSIARAAVALWIGMAAAAAWSQPADADIRAKTLERRVKAAYLSRFTEYIEWPADAFVAADSPIVIAIRGGRDIADELVEITRGRSVQGRPIVVRQLAPDDPVNGAHLVFADQRSAGELDRLAAQAQAASALSTSEAPGALERGIVINFLIVADRVRFEVSLPAAARNRLKLSSRLLAVAYRVQTQP